MRSLGYAASLFEGIESVAVEIKQEEAPIVLLSLTRASDLIACPLPHPLRLSDFERKSSVGSWFEFPRVN
ncbi:MAG: hypothetical protein J2P21_26920 [Chloracidobacterium sp.]|nr:hypothetical protein [Chloracidobacterium sp.]